jgi:hypothetical protein
MNRKRTIPPFPAPKPIHNTKGGGGGQNSRLGFGPIPPCKKFLIFKLLSFRTDMGRKPSPAHSIDRIDNNCAPRPLEGPRGISSGGTSLPSLVNY